MARQCAILTCVTNIGGRGPGHSALVVDDTVHTFENAGDWFSLPTRERSGWRRFGRAAYLAQNTQRPVIVQVLDRVRVDAADAEAYVVRSTADDDDYIGSGVCSSQVANAVDAASPTLVFNPRGIDTPYKVFHLARTMGLATTTYAIWAGTNANASAKLAKDYPSVTTTRAAFAWF